MLSKNLKSGALEITCLYGYVCVHILLITYVHRFVSSDLVGSPQVVLV